MSNADPAVIGNEACEGLVPADINQVEIAGAGCAGTLLALQLVERGFCGEIHLSDRRTAFDREQRWCFWGDAPLNLDGIVKQTWTEWAVQSGHSMSVHRPKNWAYQEIDAPRFFEWAHAKLRRQPQVQFHLGEKVDLPSPNQQLDEGIATVDATGVRPNSTPPMWQSFLGWSITVPRSTFNRDRAIIMDHRAVGPGITFGYVLPRDAHHALIEITCFTEKPLSHQVLVDTLEQYLAQQFPGALRSCPGEEFGHLPMGHSPPTLSDTDARRFQIGAGGGSLRPSSGYGFLAAARQANSVASAILGKGTMPAVRPSKFDWFDPIFIAALIRNPDQAGEWFYRLFANTPSDSLIRFLQDASTWIDDLRIIAALPKLPFLRELIR